MNGYDYKYSYEYFYQYFYSGNKSNEDSALWEHIKRTPVPEDGQPRKDIAAVGKQQMQFQAFRAQILWMLS